MLSLDNLDLTSDSYLTYMHENDFILEISCFIAHAKNFYYVNLSKYYLSLISMSGTSTTFFFFLALVLQGVSQILQPASLKSTSVARWPPCCSLQTGSPLWIHFIKNAWPAPSSGPSAPTTMPSSAVTTNMFFSNAEVPPYDRHSRFSKMMQPVWNCSNCVCSAAFSTCFSSLWAWLIFILTLKWRNTMGLCIHCHSFILYTAQLS